MRKVWIETYRNVYGTIMHWIHYSKPSFDVLSGHWTSPGYQYIPEEDMKFFGFKPPKVGELHEYTIQTKYVGKIKRNKKNSKASKKSSR